MFASCKKSGSPPDVGSEAEEESVAAVLTASRALVGVAAQSIAAVDRVADVVEVRALVVVSELRAPSLREFANGLGMHVSTASRLCDRLVAARLVDRRDDPADRRQLAIRLTSRGRGVVNRVLLRRREIVADILGRMAGEERARLVEALTAFARAAGDVPDRDLWGVGWAG
jgi:DNA-binding MarR family transcriptional regulator